MKSRGGGKGEEEEEKVAWEEWGNSMNTRSEFSGLT